MGKKSEERGVEGGGGRKRGPYRVGQRPPPSSASATPLAVGAADAFKQLAASLRRSAGELGPFIRSPRLGPSKPHKETFVPRLVEWSLVLEVVKEIQGG